MHSPQSKSRPFIYAFDRAGLKIQHENKTKYTFILRLFIKNTKRGCPCYYLRMFFIEETSQIMKNNLMFETKNVRSLHDS